MKLKKIKNKNGKINDGHYLELMDRLHVIMCNLEDHCMKHPLAKKENSIKFGLEYAMSQIWDVYQVVGKKSIKKNAIQKVISGRHKDSKD